MNAVDNPYPEPAKSRGMLAAIGLGLIGELPGGGVVSAGIQELMNSAQKERDAEWAALVGARLAHLEDQGVKVDVQDPGLLAAIARLHRSAQETDDGEKRQLLAAAVGGVACGGRTEFVALVAELEPIHVAVLAFYEDPFTVSGHSISEGIETDSGKFGRLGWIGERFGLDGAELSRVHQVLEYRMLIEVPRFGGSEDGHPIRTSSAFGKDFLDFLRLADPA